MSGPTAPVKIKTDQKDGEGLSQPWRDYFNKLGSFLMDSDGVNVLIATGKKKINSVTYSTNPVNLTHSDFGKMVKINNGTLNYICNLPSVGSSEVDSIIYIMRLGIGGLTIQAADLDTIEGSVPGGCIKDNETDRPMASAILYLGTETHWIILGGTAKWTVS